MKTLAVILAISIIVEIVLALVNAWVKWSTNKIIDDFCRGERKRFEGKRTTEERKDND